MKNLFKISLLATTVALSAHAGNVYVQGDLGYSQFTIDDFPGHQNTFNQRISLGYDFDNPFRLAVDYTHFRKIHKSAHDENISAEGSVKLSSVGVTGLYDFNINDINAKLVPYIGIRLSHNNINATVSRTTRQSFNYLKYRDNYVGFGALGGAQYKINERISLNGNIEYNRFSRDLELNEVGARLGVRVNF